MEIISRGKVWTVLSQHNEENQHTVTIARCGNTLAVIYGAEFNTFKLYEDVAAFREFGHCVRHAIECNGSLEKC